MYTLITPRREREESDMYIDKLNVMGGKRQADKLVLNLLEGTLESWPLHIHGKILQHLLTKELLDKSANLELGERYDGM